MTKQEFFSCDGTHRGPCPNRMARLAIELRNHGRLRRFSAGRGKPAGCGISWNLAGAMRSSVAQPPTATPVRTARTSPASTETNSGRDACACIPSPVRLKFSSCRSSRAGLAGRTTPSAAPRRAARPLFPPLPLGDWRGGGIAARPASTPSRAAGRIFSMRLSPIRVPDRDRRPDAHRPRDHPIQCLVQGGRDVPRQSPLHRRGRGRGEGQAIIDMVATPAAASPSSGGTPRERSARRTTSRVSPPPPQRTPSG